MSEANTAPADGPPEPEDALRRHPEGTAEGGDQSGDSGGEEVPREHSEDPVEG